MVSLIAPIYRADFLEGVSGVDVTLDAFVERLMGIEIPWGGVSVMLDETGGIVAIQSEAASVLSLDNVASQLNQQKQKFYQGFINQTVALPENINISSLPDGDTVKALTSFLDSLKPLDEITIDGQDYFINKMAVDKTVWKMLTLVRKENALASVYELRALSNWVGYAAVIGMAIFYVVFFVVMLARSKRLAKSIVSPLSVLSEQTKDLASNFSRATVSPVGIHELDALAENFNKMSAALVEYHNELLHAKREAEQSSEAKSRFLSMMSHELRTPLNHIVGLMALAEDTLATLSDQEPAEMLQLAQQSADDLLVLIQSLLDVAQFEHGVLTLNAISFPLNELFERVEHYARQLAKDTSYELGIQYEPCAVVVVADPLRLQQAIFNLVNNAFKFSEPPSQIRIGFAVTPGHGQSLSLTVRVSDQGEGIDPAYQTDIFDAFQQTDNSLTRKYGGSGLGLALCKLIVVQMGGRIWYEGNPNKGTIFFIEVPLKFEEGGSGLSAVS